jgi:hypothetical protein
MSTAWLLAATRKPRTGHGRVWVEGGHRTRLLSSLLSSSSRPMGYTEGIMSWPLLLLTQVRDDRGEAGSNMVPESHVPWLVRGDLRFTAQLDPDFLKVALWNSGLLLGDMLAFPKHLGVTWLAASWIALIGLAHTFSFGHLDLGRPTASSAPNGSGRMGGETGDRTSMTSGPHVVRPSLLAEIIGHLSFVTISYGMPRRCKGCFTFGELTIVAMTISLLTCDWLDRVRRMTCVQTQSALLFVCGETILIGGLVSLIVCLVFKSRLKGRLPHVGSILALVGLACLSLVGPTCGTRALSR